MTADILLHSNVIHLDSIEHAYRSPVSRMLLYALDPGPHRERARAGGARAYAPEAVREGHLRLQSKHEFSGAGTIGS